MKRNITLLVFGIVILLGCTKKGPESNIKTTYIQGNIKTTEYRENIILTKETLLSDESECYLVELDKLGSFNYSLSLDYPQTIHLGLSSTEYYSFLAYPGDSVYIEINDSINQISYSNTEHQKLNASLRFIQSEIQNTINRKGNCEKDLSEKEYKYKLDSLRMDLLEKADSFSAQDENKPYYKYLRNEIDFFYITTLYDYEFLNKFIFKQERQIPKGYYNLIDTILNNYNDLTITQWTFNFFNRIQILYSNEDGTINFKEITKLDSSLIRDIVLSRAIYTGIFRKEFKKAKTWLDSYNSLIFNDLLKEQLIREYETSLSIFNNPDLKYAKIKSIKSNGKEDVLGEIIKSNPGKVLYIKFWAPFCSPCIEQNHFIPQIEEKFHPNDFCVINICLPFSTEKWKATIKQYNIGGLHYILTDAQYNQLKAMFNLSGIPRYFLIDKKGNIIDDNAPIPGDYIMNGVNYDLVNKIQLLIKEK